MPEQEVTPATTHRQPVRTVTVNRPNISLAAIVLIALFGVGGFFGGMQYQKSHSAKASSPANSSLAGGFGNQGGPGGGARGGFGTVSAISDSSLAIRDNRTSTTKTYTITSSTVVTDNGAASTISAIQTGDSVLVQTASNSSTAAIQIMLNPTMGGGPGSASGNAPTSTTTN